ncbi:MAG: N-acetyltransferase, partial [Prevotella sp.]|nr:N-acetyltransferase [Candidatus Equicola stercoris]
MNIRLEQPEDYREVENLTREAFWNVYAPGCVEHYVLNQYRSNPDFIPELDFVMEVDSTNSLTGKRIIGHIMFSRAKITLDSPLSGELEGATFGPISIHPDYKRKGYGLKLLQYALEKARKMGIGIVCMEGNIDFYKHAGFVVASTLGIHYHAEPKEAEVPYFLAQELIPGYLNGIGTYHTPKGYYVAFENKEAFEAYEATFPPKEKKVIDGQLVDDCTKNP